MAGPVRLSWCLSIPEEIHGIADSVERVTIQELIPHIDATYRTQACRKGRAIEGFSMGGYGAIKWAIRYPEVFCSAVSYSGKFSFLCPDKVSGDLKKIIEEDTGPALDSGLQIRMTAGSNEQELLDEFNEYLPYLEDAGFIVENEVITGIAHSIADSYQRKGEAGLDFHCKILSTANCPSANVIPRGNKTSPHKAKYSWGNVYCAKDGLITLRLNDNNKVSMALYDMSGRLMQVLLSEEMKNKGSYNIQLSVKTLPPGTYVISLSIAEKTHIVSLPIVK